MTDETPVTVTPEAKEDAYFRLAMEEAARGMADLARMMQLPAGSRDMGKVGGIAIGFERAACAMRQKPYVVDVPGDGMRKGTLG